VTANELRELLVSMPLHMTIGVEYPEQQRVDSCNQTVDVRGTRVIVGKHRRLVDQTTGKVVQ
jgi:hypothetical protein